MEKESAYKLESRDLIPVYGVIRYANRNGNARRKFREMREYRSLQSSTRKSGLRLALLFIYTGVVVSSIASGLEYLINQF